MGQYCKILNPRKKRTLENGGGGGGGLKKNIPEKNILNRKQNIYSSKIISKHRNYISLLLKTSKTFQNGIIKFLELFIFSVILNCKIIWLFYKIYYANYFWRLPSFFGAIYWQTNNKSITIKICYEIVL